MTSLKCFSEVHTFEPDKARKYKSNGTKGHLNGQGEYQTGTSRFLEYYQVTRLASQPGAPSTDKPTSKQEESAIQSADFEERLSQVAGDITQLHYPEYACSPEHDQAEQVLATIAAEIRKTLGLKAFYENGKEERISKNISQAIQDALMLINTFSFNDIIAAEVTAVFNWLSAEMPLAPSMSEKALQALDQRLKSFSKSLHASLRKIADHSKAFNPSQSDQTSSIQEYFLKSNYGKTHLVFSSGKPIDNTLRLEVVEGMVQYFFMQHLKERQKRAGNETIEGANYSWLPYSSLCLAKVNEVDEKCMIVTGEDEKGSEKKYMLLQGKRAGFQLGDTVLMARPTEGKSKAVLRLFKVSDPKRYVEGRIIGLV